MSFLSLISDIGNEFGEAEVKMLTAFVPTWTHGLIYLSDKDNTPWWIAWDSVSSDTVQVQVKK